MAAKRKIDWDAIEPAWRAGVKSVLQIAADYKESSGVSVSHTAINAHFKKLGIGRDLSAKVQAKAKSIVSAAMVSGKVSAESSATDAQIINQSAVDVATVMLTHRADIRRNRELSQALLAEIESQTGDLGAYEQLIGLLQSGEQVSDKAVDAYRRVMSTPGRIDSVKKLAETLKILVGLEREAFGMEKGTPDDDEPITIITRRIIR